MNLRLSLSLVSVLLADERSPKENRRVTHRCWKSLPPVVEFDANGKYVRGWGPSGPQVQRPKTEHGIYVDPEGNVWIAGNGNEDHQILKFRPDGRFLMQIGRPGKSEGYGNRRIVVFDADTGAYKRHWGAYGAAELGFGRRMQKFVRSGGAF